MIPATHEVVVDEFHIGELHQGSIILAYEDSDRTKKHYFMVVYLSLEDPNTTLNMSAYALMITTKVDRYISDGYSYSVPMKLNSKNVVLLCDKLYRIDFPNIILCCDSTPELYSAVRTCYKTFLKELNRQVSKKGGKHNV